jgi:hypothetical protein
MQNGTLESVPFCLGLASVTSSNLTGLPSAGHPMPRARSRFYLPEPLALTGAPGPLGVAVPPGCVDGPEFMVLLLPCIFFECDLDE